MLDPPAGAQHDYPLAQASTEGVQVGVVGSGSNLLVADAGTGVRGPILRVDGELTTIELQGRRIPCGGPATTAECGRR
jgi:hypothetical protein